MIQKVSDAKPVHFFKRLLIMLSSLTLADLYWFDPNLILQIKRLLQSASSYKLCGATELSIYMVQVHDDGHGELEKTHLQIRKPISPSDFTFLQQMQTAAAVGLIHGNCAQGLSMTQDLHRKKNLMVLRCLTIT